MPDSDFSSYTVSVYSSSVEAAVTLNVQGLFSNETTGVDRALYLQALATSGSGTPVVKDGKQTHVVKRAFGVRFVLEVADWDSDVGFSFSAVVAKAKLSVVQTSYRLEFFGLPEVLKQSIRTSIIQNDFVSRISMVSLHRLISEMLPEWLERKESSNPRTDAEVDTQRNEYRISNPSVTAAETVARFPYERPALGAQEIRIPTGSPEDDSLALDSTHHALVHIARGDTLAVAKSSAVVSSSIVKAMSHDVIEQVYARRAGIRPDSGEREPSPKAASDALKLLNKVL